MVWCGVEWGAISCDAMRQHVMRSGAIRCDATRSDERRRDGMEWNELGLGVMGEVGCGKLMDGKG